MSDASIAEIGRRLAEALQDVAYSRSEVDKKNLAAINYELVTAVKEEKAATDVKD